ncbi:hypothetical protein [Pseudoxanthomonas sp. 10H]|uniref:hypothetical protein n=1 Tax=Pseudoxanthomonas sp. 10H TaxID=3242729 RepID=UPI00355736E5
MRLIAALFACLCAAPAVADELAELDLALPQAASPYRNDPPGTWYGDRSGVPAPAPAAPARVARPACPTGPDGQERAVTGSFTTGVGYSSQLGSSTYNGAGLGYCNSWRDADGDERTLNLQMHVDRYDGPDMRHRPYRGPR